MLRSLLTFVMIALIALQSLASVADTHGLHQTGGEHLEHAHALSAKASTQPNDVSQDLECNHCCHCHGTVHFFLDADVTTHLPQLLSTGQTDYHINYTSYHPTPDNPPPIN